MATALDHDSGLGAVLDQLGWQRVTDEAQLRQADVVALGPDWAQLRGWRLGGVTTPALVYLQGASPPEARAPLEPVAWVDRATPEAVERALAQLDRGRQDRRIDLGEVVVDLPRRQLRRDDTTVRLSQREADLLAYLAARSDREVGREELLTEVWGHAKATATRSVDMAVYRLRRKLEPDPSEPRFLVSSYGGGYRLLLATDAAEEAAPLVGRSALLRQVQTTLASERHVVLFGPSGVGKTRLANAVARRFATSRRVSLDGARSIDEAIARVATELGLVTPVTGSTDETVRSVGTAIETRGHRLLVLDDADHAPGLAGALIATSPNLAVLATQQLRPRGAPAVAVGPLSAEATRDLLVHHVPTASDDPDLPMLLELLDGLPLAVELAASLLVHVPAEALLARAQALSEALVDPDGDQGARHRGIAASLSWAWERLDERARAVLALLAAFHGTTHVDDLEAAWGSPEVLAYVVQLVEGGWLRGDGAAVRLLHPMRSWVRARLQGPLATRVQAAHLRWAVAQARDLAQALPTRRASEAIRRLAPLRADLDMAWREASRPDELASLTRALDAIDSRHGTYAARRARLDEALLRLGDTPLGLELVVLDGDPIQPRLDGDVDVQAHALARARAGVALDDHVGQLYHRADAGIHPGALHRLAAGDPKGLQRRTLGCPGEVDHRPHAPAVDHGHRTVGIDLTLHDHGLVQHHRTDMGALFHTHQVASRRGIHRVLNRRVGHRHLQLLHDADTGGVDTIAARRCAREHVGVVVVAVLVIGHPPLGLGTRADRRVAEPIAVVIGKPGPGQPIVGDTGAVLVDAVAHLGVSRKAVRIVVVTVPTHHHLTRAWRTGQLLGGVVAGAIPVGIVEHRQGGAAGVRRRVTVGVRVRVRVRVRVAVRVAVRVRVRVRVGKAVVIICTAPQASAKTRGTRVERMGTSDPIRAPAAAPAGRSVIVRDHLAGPRTPPCHAGHRNPPTTGFGGFPPAPCPPSRRPAGWRGCRRDTATTAAPRASR